MEMETEHSNDKPQISPPLTLLSRWIAEQVTLLAEAMGGTVTPVRLKIYAGDLADIGQSQLAVAFHRARRECRFFPKIAELRELAGASREQEQDGEVRKTWDVLQTFVRKYVSNDVYGTYGPEHGWYPKTFPQLSDHILDTVRRSGGWKTYKCMTDEDFPFVQKRFFEEFLAWTAVERVDLGHMLTAVPESKRLMAPAIPVEANPAKGCRFKPKPISQALTDAQLRDRREMLKQQLATLLRGSQAVEGRDCSANSANRRAESCIPAPEKSAPANEISAAP
jgi:hypothetical protein